MQRQPLSRRRLLAVGAGLLAAPAVARAQGFPNRPIRLIVGFPPGGGADAFARLVGPYLTERLGRPIVVENRSGANGLLATEFVSKATPDGHTLLLSTSSAMVAAPLSTPNMPVNPIRDLTHISMATESEFVMLVAPGLPVRSFQEFLALAKREQGKLVHATPGIGSANHVAAELLSLREGVSLNTVHYRGSAPIFADLISNQVQMTIASVGLAEPFVKDGRARALLLFSKARTPQLPEVPTSAEAGLADIDQITLWFGLHGPKDMPMAIARQIREALVEAYRVEALKDRMAALALKQIADTSEAFTARMESDLRLYGEIFRTANIRIE